MNIRKYVKIMINTNETENLCHKFCIGDAGEYCTIFNQAFNREEDKKRGVTKSEFYTHVRLLECKDQQLLDERR